MINGSVMKIEAVGGVSVLPLVSGADSPLRLIRCTFRNMRSMLSCRPSRCTYRRCGLLSNADGQPHAACRMPRKGAIGLDWSCTPIRRRIRGWIGCCRNTHLSQNRPGSGRWPLLSQASPCGCWWCLPLNARMSPPQRHRAASRKRMRPHGGLSDYRMNHLYSRQNACPAQRYHRNGGASTDSAERRNGMISRFLTLLFMFLEAREAAKNGQNRGQRQKTLSRVYIFILYFYYYQSIINKYSNPKTKTLRFRFSWSCCIVFPLKVVAPFPMQLLWFSTPRNEFPHRSGDDSASHVAMGSVTLLAGAATVPLVKPWCPDLQSPGIWLSSRNPECLLLHYRISRRLPGSVVLVSRTAQIYADFLKTQNGTKSFGCDKIVLFITFLHDFSMSNCSICEVGFVIKSSQKKCGKFVNTCKSMNNVNFKLCTLNKHIFCLILNGFIMCKLLKYNYLYYLNRVDLYVVSGRVFLKNGGILPFFDMKNRHENVIVWRLWTIVLFRN